MSIEDLNMNPFGSDGNGEGAGLYIHIPFCARKCNYCDFASVAGKMEHLPAYLRALEKEMENQSRHYPSINFKTLFVGGGTPSLLSPPSYGELMKAVHRCFHLDGDAEVTLEANPGTITIEKADAMAAAGFNRVSMGMQARQSHLLSSMGRIHRHEDVEESVRCLRRAGIHNLNLDLMFGLPEQTVEMWQETLEAALALDVQHLSCYSLSIEEGTVWGDLHKAHRLDPVEDSIDRDMYHFARNKLASAGYTQYELSNFAKSGFSCRHNLIYWSRGNYLGIGAGAHSLMGVKRFANKPDPVEYLQDINSSRSSMSEEQRLTNDDGLTECMLMGMRLMRGLDLNVVSKRFHVDVAAKFEKEIRQLEENELLIRDGQHIRLSEKGLDFANQVFMAFV